VKPPSKIIIIIKGDPATLRSLQIPIGELAKIANAKGAKLSMDQRPANED
jgi:hypothetical protein